MRLKGYKLARTSRLHATNHRPQKQICLRLRQLYSVGLLLDLASCETTSALLPTSAHCRTSVSMKQQDRLAIP